MNTITRALRGVRHRVAATVAVGALAASSMFAAQPVSADTTYPVNVTFDNVQFTMVNDGTCASWFNWNCGSDSTFEAYGTVGAYTTAGAVSAANGMPYRLFGKWGSHPCEVSWAASYGITCTKEIGLGTWDFTKVFLCQGSQSQTCSTGYTKSNNTIPLQVHPGEQFKLTVNMQDYDALSANDTICAGSMWFGPYTAAELAAKKFVTDSQGKVIQQGFNGDAECFVHFHLS